MLDKIRKIINQPKQTQPPTHDLFCECPECRIKFDEKYVSTIEEDQW